MARCGGVLDLAVGASLWDSRRSMCAGNTGEIDAMSIYTRTKTRITPNSLRFGLDPQQQALFQAAVARSGPTGFLRQRPVCV